jgi:hypothetical protein
MIARGAWAVAALGLCAVACGTTVPEVTATRAGGAVNGGLEAPAPGGPAAVELGGSGEQARPEQARSATDQPTSTRTPNQAPTPTDQGSSLTAKGRGFDARTAYIGVTTQKDASTALAAIGVAGLDFGDQEAQARAAIAEVNRTGGLLSRKLVPRFYDVKSADALTNPQTAAEAACRGLTEDTQVVAVVNLVAAIDLPSFNACLKKHETPVVSGGFVPASNGFFQSLDPYHYGVAAPAYDVMAPLLVARLQALHYFAGWDTTNGGPGNAPVKVGIIHKDSPDQRRIANHLMALLKQRGVDVARTFAYDGSSTQATTSGQANAVLPFRTAGVTHVLHLSSEVFYFMNAAENQSYRPRYGLTSLSGTNLLLQGSAPARQLSGSLGIGWLPAADVDAQNRPSTAGGAVCTRAMRAGGQSVSGGAALTAAEFCDAVFLVAQAARAGGGFSADALRDGANRLDRSFRPAATFRSGLSTRSTTVPAAARDLAWDAQARVFRYLGTTTRAW